MPASSCLPDWYRRTHTGVDEMTPPGVLPNRFTFKACMPFGDAMRNGYVQTTWTDMMIDTTVEHPPFLQRTQVEMVSVRESQQSGSYIPKDADLIDKVEFVWKMPWLPVMPKGWSVLITHPLNRFDLPFTVTSGIIDADKFHHAPFGNVPFYMKRNYKGIIPAGTPMYQIVPIRREHTWRASFSKSSTTDIRKRETRISRHLTGAYRDNFWTPKRFKAETND